MQNVTRLSILSDVILKSTTISYHVNFVFYNLGAGAYSTTGSTGANHAGKGGRGNGILVTTSPYGGLYSPGVWGSGGGGHSSGGGGRGGGRIKLQINGSFAMSGRITVNGQSGTVSQIYNFIFIN